MIRLQATFEDTSHPTSLTMEIEFYPPVLQTVLNTGDRIYFVRDEKDRTNKAMQNLQDRYDKEDKEEDNKRRNVRVYRWAPFRKPML